MKNIANRILERTNKSKPSVDEARGSKIDKMADKVLNTLDPKNAFNELILAMTNKEATEYLTHIITNWDIDEKVKEDILRTVTESLPIEETDITAIIKELIDTGWSGSNEEQMKAVQLLKGLATSDDPESNEFMKKLDKFTSGMKVSESKVGDLSNKLDSFASELKRAKGAITSLKDKKAAKALHDRIMQVANTLSDISLDMDKLNMGETSTNDNGELPKGGDKKPISSEEDDDGDRYEKDKDKKDEAFKKGELLKLLRREVEDNADDVLSEWLKFWVEVGETIGEGDIAKMKKAHADFVKALGDIK